MPRLLVRPKREPGEWAPSWVCRSLQDNGVTYDCHPSSVGVDSLARTVMDLDALKQCEVVPRDAHTATFCGHVVPLSAIRRMGPGLSACPICIRERRYMPAVWRLQHYTFCHVHHRPLEDRCSRCSRPISLGSVVRGGCTCAPGAAVEVEGPTTQSFSVDWTKLVWSAGWPDFALEEPKVLARAVFLTRLLFAVARSRRGRDLKLRAFAPAVHVGLWLKREGLAAELQGGEPLQFLKSLVHSVHRRAAALLIQQAIHLERMHPTVFSSLPLEDMLETTAPQGRIGSGVSGLACLAYAARLPGFEPVQTAAKRLGISPGAVRALVGSEHLVESTPYGGGRRVQLVSTVAVQRAAMKLPAPSPQRSDPVVSSWKMPRTVARQFRLSGWLPKFGSPCVLRHTRKQATGELLGKLRKCARGPAPAGQRTISLTSPYVYGRVDSLVLGQLLSQVVNGAVPLYATSVEPDFGELFLPLEVLPRLWRARSPRRQDQPMSDAQLHLF